MRIGKFIKSPYFKKAKNRLIDMIVIHYISLPPGDFSSSDVIDFFTGKLDFSKHPFYEKLKDLRVSTHFFIRRSGEIIQFVDTEDIAYHAGESEFRGRKNCNLYSIGIELEGDEDHPFTENQYKSLVHLCSSLMKEYKNITIDRIVGHCDIAPKRKKDPGKYFDWEYFRKLLKNALR